MNMKIVKVINLVCIIGSAALSLLSGIAEDKKMDMKIEEIIQKKLTERT